MTTTVILARIDVLADLIRAGRAVELDLRERQLAAHARIDAALERSAAAIEVLEGHEPSARPRLKLAKMGDDV